MFFICGHLLIILTKNSFMCKICFYELIHDYFLSVIIMQIVLFERMEISNFCSHSVHACETLWSDSNRADRKDFTKINGAAPADPLSTLGTHDTPGRIVFALSSWWSLSCLHYWNPTRVFRKHAPNANRRLRFPFFQIKQFALC